MCAARFIKKSTGAFSKSGASGSQAERQFYDPVIPQVERKLRKLERYKDVAGEELRQEVERLINPEQLQYELSHLIVREILPGDDTCQSIAYQYACIRLQILVRDDILDPPQLSASCSISEFLRANYGKKHIALVLNDLVLFWGEESIVIPQRLDEYESLPGLHPVVEKIAHCLYCSSDSESAPIFNEVIEVISKYNKTFYYSSRRSSQNFVCDVLKALGISSKCFSLSDQMLLLQEEKSNDVPDSFGNHKDLNMFVMSKSKTWLAQIEAGSMEYLQSFYGYFHGKKTDCPMQNCQSSRLSDISQHRSRLSSDY